MGPGKCTLVVGISLPNNWTARDYQAEPFDALDSGIRRVISIWHRRSGKDNAGINYMAKAAHRDIGNYWYLFPNARQARRALWENVDHQTGKKVIDQAIPKELRATVRNDEMFIGLKCGSSIQVTGADQFDSLVGANPRGIVFSEYAITSPLVFRYLSPILRVNKGWAWFNSTPRGRNHLYRLVEQNKKNPDWFITIKSWRDTGVLTQADIDAEIRDGMPVETAQQEYECSFDAASVGVVYSQAVQRMWLEGRIRDVPVDDRYPVETWWDIGHRDATAIIFAQRLPDGRIHIVDYFEAKGQGLPFFAGELAKKPYPYNRHVGPHDMENKIFAIDASTQMVARNFGLHFAIAPRIPKAEGINATRMFLSRCHIDATRCAQLVAALEHYQYEWDEDTLQFTTDTAHDWSSHPCDALRYGVVTPAEIGVVPPWAMQQMAAAQNWTRDFSHVLPQSGFPGMFAPRNPWSAGLEHDPLAEWR